MSGLLPKAIPLAVAIAAGVALFHWFTTDFAPADVALRIPGQDHVGAAASQPAADLRGTFEKGPGVAGTSVHDWPRFRGAKLDATSTDPTPLLAAFPAGGLKTLWEVELGEGYAGPAVRDGRVYMLDYDLAKRADALRCLSLTDGREIWRRCYSIDVARNHGLSRTVPAVAGRYVVTIGPKCHVLCADATSGDFLWGIDLVHDYGTTVPQWYAGQCPLIDGDKVILAPGGSNALLMAVDCATGKVLWKTPNPRLWQMTHSSIIPHEFAGKRAYVYCASGGVVAVSAEDGTVLWETSEWKVSMANVPTPLPVAADRLLLTGGYGAGSMMLALAAGDSIAATPAYRLKPEQFAAEQQTPIFHQGHIYGVIPGGQLACLRPDGKILWTSSALHRFGLGSYILAGGVLILVNDTGQLSLVAATPDRFNLLSETRIFEEGQECWGPMALVDGLLLVRDLTRLVCVDLRKASYE